jgi:ribonuclease P protein component
MPRGPSLPPAGLRLPRAARLTQKRDFVRLKTGGRRLGNGCLILNWLPRADRQAARLGVVTSRKVGTAVVRSRARRLLREVWRRNQHGPAAGLDMVLVARPSIRGKKLAEVESDFHAALRRAGLTKNHVAG